MISLSTNSSALSAIRSLSESNSRLETLQARMSTGLKVSSFKDNAAVFSMAQGLRGDKAGLNATLAGIDAAIISVDIASITTQSISNLLIKAKGAFASLVSAQKSGDSQAEAAHNNTLDSLRATIQSRISSPAFNGLNLIEQTQDIVEGIARRGGGEPLDFDHESLLFDGEILTFDEETGYSADAINSSIDNANSAQSHLGTAARRLEIEKEFTTKLHDAVEAGIGKLVDADLAETAVELQSELVKQQLSVAALNIANQAPNIVESLFIEKEPKTK